ncbi:alpha/beta hydrolase fold domain-containing protein [Curtobacterium sp. VKM Ac-2865]|uniref:alpha/beta hydrolase n=1 Tax=Curtobacterium sp. VKM Ac-2865 TaxID=2783817 RepID=UPI00188A2820|nr:alpha/beta hydrolase fold domain-containing protein [Curtobacterium sp. VKM Ac-2865]MBF4581549.1 alpha/beta hydrolase fold domain-containing protein [Curtobacterium sp. VKM Ac-2865]
MRASARPGRHFSSNRSARCPTPCPDRRSTRSCRSSGLVWDAYLGDHRDGEVSVRAAPARATDLRGMPPTYLDCGSAEVFRDETVAFASRLWAAGVDAELHVWPGAFHGFTSMVPNAVVSRRAVAALGDWTTRLLEGSVPERPES